MIATQDRYRGESVKAVVVLRPAHRGQVSEQDIVDWCRDHMAVYKAPRRVVILDELPKTPTGKIQRAVMREQVLKG
mgnify:CR=1 FL=1